MSTSTADHRFVERLMEESCGDRLTALTAEQRGALRGLFADALWGEGIEALTPARVDSLVAHVAATRRAAA